MMELPLVFLAGALGSSHCIGMCGGFALALGARTPLLRHNLLRQSVYSAGRIFTYGTAGVLAGAGGQRLALALQPYLNVPAFLALFAGLLLIGQGMIATGMVPRRSISAAKLPCQASRLFGSLLNAPHLGQVFLAGLFTGMLPCGFVYAFLSLAASSGSFLLGGATMVAFGLGTMPLMLLAGTGSSLLPLPQRQRMLQIAAWSLVLAGTVSVVRGAAYLSVAGYRGGGCPACQAAVPAAPQHPLAGIRRQLGNWTER
jgi:sulfite exporter TauE/SafE